MPKLSELEVGSNKKPASSRSAFLGTEEAQGFDDLRAYVLAQEKEKKEEERERKLDLGLSPEGKIYIPHTDCWVVHGADVGTR